MLEKTEYSTVLSSGGDEAIARIEQDPPYDLVLSDLTIAGRDGHGLIEPAAPDTAGDTVGIDDARPGRGGGAGGGTAGGLRLPS